MSLPLGATGGSALPRRDTELRVAMDMTFPNRFPTWGFSVYAHSLMEALQRRGDISLREIASLAVSGPRQTVRWLASGARGQVMMQRSDLLHCPAFVTPWRSPVPVVISVFDAAARRFPQDYSLEWRLYDRYILPLVAHRAARVITLTEYSRREVIKYYRFNRNRVVVTPAAPGLHYKPQSSEQVRQVLRRYSLLESESITTFGPEQASGKGPLLLFSGAPFPRKNLDIVLRVMASAPVGSALASVGLLISGATETGFDQYRAWIAAHGLQERVRWLGRVAHDEMPALYAAADVLVYPSLYEGFGLPPLESMSVGTPVISSTASCLPEVLGDGAILVRPNDDERLAQAIEAVLTRPELRARLVARGKARAAGYSWERCAQETVEVYRQAVRRRVS